MKPGDDPVERAAFEAACRAKMGATDRCFRLDCLGEYWHNNETGFAWRAWRAGREYQPVAKGEGEAVALLGFTEDEQRRLVRAAQEATPDDRAAFGKAQREAVAREAFIERARELLAAVEGTALTPFMHELIRATRAAYDALLRARGGA